MNVRSRLLCLGMPAALAALLGGAPPAWAGSLTVTSRLSGVRFTGVGLDTGDPVVITSTDFSAPFVETIQGEASNVEPGGATNHALWHVSQDSRLDPTQVTCEAQVDGFTQTDFGSVGIFMASDFELVFEVPAAVEVRLDGGVVAAGHDTWSRVQLLRDAAAMFNTEFGHTFPFVATLTPGRTYTLRAQAHGESLFNDATFSSAIVTMTILTCAGDVDGDEVIGVTDLGPLLANFGTEQGAGLIDGDVDGDGDVDVNDLGLLLSLFGTTCP